MGITIPGVGDMQDSLEFRTRRGTYRIELYQLIPGVEPAPFRMRVEVAPTAAEPGQAAERASADLGNVIVGTTAHEFLCERGSADRCVDAAFGYMKGRGVAVDLARARALFERGCAGYNALGCYGAGTMKYSGQGGPVDKAGARSAWERACDGGEPDGCHAVGVMKYNGQGGPVDKRGARAAHDRACSEGSAESCFYLASMKRRGDGGAKEERGALGAYRKACALGYEKACAAAREFASGGPR